MRSDFGILRALIQFNRIYDVKIARFERHWWGSEMKSADVNGTASFDALWQRKIQLDQLSCNTRFCAHNQLHAFILDVSILSQFFFPASNNHFPNLIELQFPWTETCFTWFIGKHFSFVDWKEKGHLSCFNNFEKMKQFLLIIGNS